MTDFILDFIRAYAALWGFCVAMAGIRSALLFGGPGAFELVGMLWRGEIRRAHAE